MLVLFWYTGVCVCASAKPLPLQTEWVVPPEAKAKYDTYFQGIDKDHDGIVSGDEARTLFMASNLPPKLLAHVWWVGAMLSVL